MIHTVCILIGVPGGPGGSELQGRSRPLLHLRLHHLTSNFGRTLRFPTWETASLTPGQHPSFVKPLIRFWPFHKGSGTYIPRAVGGGGFWICPHQPHLWNPPVHTLSTLCPTCILDARGRSKWLIDILYESQILNPTSAPWSRLMKGSNSAAGETSITCDYWSMTYAI